MYQGQRPEKPKRFLVAGVILLGLVALLWGALHFLFDKPDHANGFAIMMSACFIFGTLWSARRANSQPEVSPGDLLKVLERFQA